ncbi:hypothetical protein [Halobaculum sp. D14]|uniref:hypothetical protein n=1 Tax=Halobaculum sp. D14 TaxID=3421642 RepID=UPI003EBA0CAC
MSGHVPRESSTEGGSAHPALPFSIPHSSQLTWELGSRVVDDEEATALDAWQHADSRWEVTAFEVAAHTRVLRLRTPVGRERYYGVADDGFDTATDQLERARDWTRR